MLCIPTYLNNFSTIRHNRFLLVAFDIEAIRLDTYRTTIKWKKKIRKPTICRTLASFKDDDEKVRNWKTVLAFNNGVHKSRNLSFTNNKNVYTLTTTIALFCKESYWLVKLSRLYNFVGTRSNKPGVVSIVTELSIRQLV